MRVTISFNFKAIAAVGAGVCVAFAPAQAQGISTVTPGQFIAVTNPDVSGASMPIRYEGGDVEWELVYRVGAGYTSDSKVFFHYMGVTSAGIDVSGGMSFSNGSRPLDQPGRIAYTQALNTDSSVLLVDASIPEFVTPVSQTLGGQFSLIPFKAEGGGISATFSDITVNFERGEVQADIFATDYFIEPEGVPAPMENAVLWTFDKASVTGLTPMSASSLFSADSVASLTADGYVLSPRFDESANLQGYNVEKTIRIPELLMTQTGINYVGQIPFMWGNGILPLTGIPGKGGWGSLALRNSFYIAVPEPATYALMGLGLVGVVLAARRRRPGLNA